LEGLGKICFFKSLDHIELAIGGDIHSKILEGYT